MGRNLIETVMGAVVLLVAAGFLAFAYENSNVKAIDGYEIKAETTNAAGIAVGSDVRIGGIKVGVVSSLTINPDNYNAVVGMQIKEDTKIPADSSASIVGDGLLGSKYVALEPGADEESLKAGEQMVSMQPSVSLETLIGKFVFSGGGVDDDKASDKEPAADSGAGDVSAVPSVE